MNKTLIKIILFLLIYMLMPVSLFAEESKDSMDFYLVKNPFESKLPIPEKNQTPIESVNQMIDNNPVAASKPLEIKLPDVVPQKKEPPHFNLKGILWGTEHPLAIVNDIVVGVNDRIEGARVTAISKEQVTFTFMGEDFNVHMPQ